MSNKRTIITIFLAFGLLKVFGQIDSMVIFDPFSLSQKDSIVAYDPNSGYDFLPYNLGNWGKKTELSLNLPDSVSHSFTNNQLAKSKFDMLSFPIRVNVGFMHDRFTTNRKVGGSGMLIAPNAVLTAGHIIGYIAQKWSGEKYFKWRDSLVVSPSHENGNPQPTIGTIKVKKCFVFKSFVNSLGQNANDDIALVILDKPIGYEIGWVGLGWAPTDSFLLKNVFYNFCFPGVDEYDGMNMYYKYGMLGTVSYDLTSAYSSVVAVSGESGSALLYTNNIDYTGFGVRTYSTFYTLITKHKYRILKELITNNQVVTGVQNNLVTKSLRIYPNPAKDYFFIENPYNNEHLSIKIFNTQGKILVSKYDRNSNIAIDVSSFAKGMYVVKIEHGKDSLIEKLIIE